MPISLEPGVYTLDQIQAVSLGQDALKEHSHVFVDRTADGGLRAIPVTLEYDSRSEKQRIQLVRSSEFGVLLILDGEIQCASRDEGIYHEVLVHPGLYALIECQSRKKVDVLIFGGGDGCAIREAVKWPEVTSITVVEHDQEVIHLFRDTEIGDHFLSRASFLDDRVKIVIEDAFEFSHMHQGRLWDFLVMDMTDYSWRGLRKRDCTGSKEQEQRRNIINASKLIKKDGFLSIQFGPSTGQDHLTLDSLNDNLSMVGLRAVAGWSVPIFSFGESWLEILFGKEESDLSGPVNWLDKCGQRMNLMSSKPLVSVIYRKNQSS